MANPENLLINAVLTTRDWKTVQDRGIDRRELRDFKDEWLWLVEDVKRYGEVPARGEFKARFPDFVVPDEDVSDVARYCDDVIAWDARWRLIAYYDQGLKLIESDKVADALALADSSPAVTMNGAGIQPILTCLADVTAQPVEWLWERRIPFGKVTMFDGDPGAGKSHVTLDWMARLSVGRPMPGELPEPFDPTHSILVTDEDDAEDTIKPRLLAAGGDPGYVHHLRGFQVNGVEALVELPRFADQLATLIERKGAQLVVIDPLFGHLDTDVRMNVDAEVRRALRPLQRVAQQTRAAVVCIRHLNKDQAKAALYRGGASIAFAGVARSVLLAAREPGSDDRSRFVLAQVKSNLSALAPSLAYGIVEHDTVSRIEWGDPVDWDADDLLAPSKTESKQDAAEDMLRRLLKDGQRVPRPEIEDQAKFEGIGWRTVEDAKKRLGVESAKGTGKGAPWEWWLPNPDDM